MARTKAMKAVRVTADAHAAILGVVKAVSKRRQAEYLEVQKAFPTALIRTDCTLSEAIELACAAYHREQKK